jgi:hypothetical protein
MFARKRLIIDSDNQIADPEGSVRVRNNPCLIIAGFVLRLFLQGNSTLRCVTPFNNSDYPKVLFGIQKKPDTCVKS